MQAGVRVQRVGVLVQVGVRVQPGVRGAELCGADPCKQPCPVTSRQPGPGRGSISWRTRRGCQSPRSRLRVGAEGGGTSAACAHSWRRRRGPGSPPARPPAPGTRSPVPAPRTPIPAPRSPIPAPHTPLPAPRTPLPAPRCGLQPCAVRPGRELRWPGARSAEPGLRPPAAARSGGTRAPREERRRREFRRQRWSHRVPEPRAPSPGGGEEAAGVGAPPQLEPRGLRTGPLAPDRAPAALGPRRRCLPGESRLRSEPGPCRR